MRSRHTRRTALAGDSDFLKRNGMTTGSIIYFREPAPMQNGAGFSPVASPSFGGARLLTSRLAGTLAPPKEAAGLFCFLSVSIRVNPW
jgi:hypothetical protein